MRIAFLTTQRLLNEIPALKWIDKDYGQLDRYETKPAVIPDCALIRVNILRATDVTIGQQLCTANVIVRYWPDIARYDTANKASDDQRQRSLSYYDTVEDIYHKLQSYKDDQLDLFSMESMGEENRTDLIVMRYAFKTSFLWEKDNPDS